MTDHHPGSPKRHFKEAETASVTVEQTEPPMILHEDFEHDLRAVERPDRTEAVVARGFFENFS